jgi:glycosyltransferase involved in cell wall biosynthesis
MTETSADRALKPEPVHLSICIATLNRAAFIGATLDSILGQLMPGIEIIIVDGASTDATEAVLRTYAARFPQVRYVREAVNSGVDRDYDKAVGYAQGDYCWLMTDDDLLASSAVRRVMDRIRAESPDLLVVDAEVRDAGLGRVLGRRLAHVVEDRSYRKGQAAEFFRDAASHLSFIGCVIIRRVVWLARERERYYGSLFIHVGVIFQSPPLERVCIITEPLVVIRYGNAMWMPRWFEIWSFKWPDLIWSFPSFSDADKGAVTARDPWRRSKTLVLSRAMGGYTMDAYRRYLSGRVRGVARIRARLIAMSPGRLVNALAAVYLALFRPAARVEMHDLLACPNATAMARFMSRRVFR